MEIANAETIRLCHKLAEVTMESHLMARTQIYIDADTLFDFKLGALLSQMRSKEQFDAVYAHLEDYLKSPTLDCARFFPEFGLTEDDLEKILTDPALSAVLSVTAPPTNVFEQLTGFVALLRKHNAIKPGAEKMQFTINAKLTKLHPHTIRLITDAIRYGEPDAEIAFTSFKDWSEIPTALLERQDVVIVHDILDFVRPGTTSQKLLEKADKLAATAVMGLLQANLEVPPEKFEAAMENTAGVMMLMCESFAFLEKTVSKESLLFKKGDEK